MTRQAAGIQACKVYWERVAVTVRAEWEMQEEEESFEVGVKGNAFMGCRSVRRAVLWEIAFWQFRGCSVGNCFLAVKVSHFLILRGERLRGQSFGDMADWQGQDSNTL